MQTKARRLIRDRRLARSIEWLVGLCLASAPVVAAEPPAASAGTEDPQEPAAAEPAVAPETEAEAEAPELEEQEPVDTSEMVNWVEVGVGGVFLHGDKARYMQRYRRTPGAFGGLEGLHYEKQVGEQGLFKLDARGLFDLNDYAVKLELSHPEKGYLRAGYKEFRTWSDGSAGYLSVPSPQGTWFSLYDEDLYVDRGEAWVEAGLTLPDWPVFSFRYAHQFRRGKKDSTVWGDHSLTGQNAGNVQRGIVPSFWDIDEERDLFEVKASHTIKATQLGLGFRYEHGGLNNSLNMHRRPAAGDAANRYVTSTSGNDTDLFNVHGHSITRFNDKVMLTLGGSFTTLENELAGERFYGSGYGVGYDQAPGGPFDPRQAGDQGYTNLLGNSRLWEYVANLNVMYNPWEHVSIVPSLRIQKQDVEGWSSFADTLDYLGRPPVAASGNSDRGLLAVSERLDLRYSGVTNWVFYARGEWSQDQGDLSERFSGRILGGTLSRTTDYDKFTQKYTVGANWYPRRNLNWGVQYYRRMREADYTHAGPARPFLLYPGFIQQQEFFTDDINLRMTLRPSSSVTLVGRYDFQLSSIHTQAEGYPAVQSAEVTTHVFGGSATWVPHGRWYLQAGGNLVLDRTETPANELTGSQAGLVQSSRNDYWNANFMAGLVLTDKTDLQANYVYYRANNLDDNSRVSVPYGADIEEHGVTATMTRRITEQLRWKMQYGYFNGRDDLSGGHNDYEAHLVYSSVHYLF